MDHYIDDTILINKRQSRTNFRKSILDQWDNLCAYCGNKGCTLDHIKPKSKGGQHVAHNVCCACAACNGRKSSLDWVSWFRLQEFWDPEREGTLWIWIHQND